jgi:hypothetical protein
MKFLSSAVFLLLSAFAVGAEPPNLGSNLAYLRVHSLAEAMPELQVQLAEKHASVLDLRYATATEESTATLRTALTAHSAEIPLFILISPATPASLLEMIQPLVHDKLTTLGVAGSRPAPRIIVKTDAKTDRQAYDAFEHGTPITELISGKIEKDRFDEAALVNDFKNGNSNLDPPSLPDPDKSEGATEGDKPTEPATRKPAPLRDRVLQRALNLQEALLALRR